MAELLREAPDSPDEAMFELPRIDVDEARAADAGIHKIAGRRLVLYTDVPVDAEIEALPTAFDEAFGQWCDYFGVDASQHADWRMTGFLMKDKSRFAELGLLPDAVPPFRNGFSWNHVLRVCEQPSAYYRRHLVLHEGTHGFMNTVLGGCGPPWYMEGVAELLATHHWEDGVLTLRTMPRDRDEVPMWGRIKIVNEGYAAHQAWTLDRVLAYRPGDDDTVPYAWCWAAAALLDGDRRYREPFRAMAHTVREPGFNERFRKTIGDDWRDLADQWQVFVAGLEYGYDVRAAAMVFGDGRPLPADGATVTVDADKGWQSSGVRLAAGSTYKLAAAGRYQLARQPDAWPCEPNGVSIRYYQGRPLGMLLAAVRPDESGKDDAGGFLHPLAVGLGTTFTPTRSGTLYFCVNDSAAERTDNAGALRIEISAAE